MTPIIRPGMVIQRPGSEEEKQKQTPSGVAPIITPGTTIKAPSQPLGRYVELTGPDRPDYVKEHQFGGFEIQTGQQDPLWKRILSGASTILSVFEPLLLPGDAVKSFIYGYATEGPEGGLRRLTQTLSQWRDYLPGGKAPKPSVTGYDLAKLFIDDLDNLPAWKRVGLSFSFEVLTDPLSFFGLAGAAAKGASIAARGTATITRAIQPVPRALEATSRALGVAADVAMTADRYANLALNPYSIAFRGTTSVVRSITSRLNDTGQELLRVQGALVDKILDIPAFKGPAEYALSLRHVAPGWYGSEKTGVGVYGIARSESQEVGELALRWVQRLQKHLNDTFGEPTAIFGLIRRNTIPESRLPLVTEIQAESHRILDSFGIVNEDQALERASKAIAKMAQATGVDPERAVEGFRTYHALARSAFLEVQAKLTGFDRYVQAFKQAAEARGVDPEMAWSVSVASRTGLLQGLKPKAVEVGPLGEVIVKEAEPIPTIIPEAERVLGGPAPSSRLTKLSARATAKVLEDPASPLAYRLAALASPQDFSSLSSKIEGFEKTLEDYLEAAKQAKETDNISSATQIIQYITTGKVPDEVDEAGRAFLEALPELFKRYGEAPNKDAFESAVKKAVDALKRNDLVAVWENLNEAAKFSDIQVVRRLLASPSQERRALGHAITSIVLDANGLRVDGMVAMGYAAAATKNPLFAAHLYGLGAPVVGKEIKPPRLADVIPEPELREVLEAGRVTRGALAAVASASRQLPKDFLAQLGREYDNPLGELLQKVATGDKQGLVEWAARAIKGEIPVDDGGLEAIYAMVKQVGGEEALARLVLNKEKVDLEDLKKVRALSLDVITEVEKEAIKRWYVQHPAWGGIRAIRTFWWGRDVADKDLINAMSPLTVLNNIRDGHARKIYLGRISPGAAEAAYIHKKLTFVPEVDPEVVGNKLYAFLRERVKVSDTTAKRAADEIREYLEVTQGRHVYTAEAIATLLNQHVRLDIRTFNEMLDEVFAHNKNAQGVLESLRRAAGEMAGAPTKNAPPYVLFDVRQERTEKLLEFYNPEAALLALGRVANRTTFISRFLAEAHRSLKEAGLVFDKLPVDPETGRAIPGFVRVPDDAVKVMEGAATAYTYGPLAGKWVPKQYLTELDRVLSTDPLSNGAWGAFLSFWRKSVLNNPVTTLRNIVGNLYLLWAFDPRLAGEAIASMPQAIRVLERYHRTGELPEELRGVIYWLKETSLNAESRETIYELYQRLAKYNPDLYQRGWLERVISKMDEWGNDLAPKIAERLGFQEGDAAMRAARALMPIHLFAMSENVMRVATYLAALKMTGNRNKAMWIAANALGDYSSVPFYVHMIRRTGLMAFPSFLYIISKKGAQWAVDRPAALLLPQHFAQASWYGGVETPEDHMRLATYMADWLKGSLPAVLPIKTREGEYLVVPLGITLPLPTLSGAMFEEVLGLGAIGPLVNAAQGMFNYLKNPISGASPVLGQSYGETLYGPASTPTQAIGGTLKYLARQYGPAYATRTLPVLEAPELIAAILHGDGTEGIETIRRVKSVVGRMVVQYTHPAAVRALEERYGTAIGLTPTEGLIATLTPFGTPRRTSVEKFGVGTRTSVRDLEEMAKEIEQALRSRIKAGEDPKKVAEVKRRLLQRLAKEMEPYQNLDRILMGYPPEGVENGR